MLGLNIVHVPLRVDKSGLTAEKEKSINALKLSTYER